MAETWPKTIARGPLRGQTFSSKRDYDAAYRALDPDQRPPRGLPRVDPATGEAVEPATRRETASMADDIRAVVQVLNLPLVLLPWTRDDALLPHETDSLVEAADNWQRHDRRARRIFKKGAEQAGIGGVIAIVVAIIMDRAVRHGWLPKPVLERMSRAEQEYRERHGMPEPAVPQAYPTPSTATNGAQPDASDWSVQYPEYREQLG